jgi:hypothetical protein
LGAGALGALLLDADRVVSLYPPGTTEAKVLMSFFTSALWHVGQLTGSLDVITNVSNCLLQGSQRYS